MSGSVEIMPVQSIESPCINICTIDKASRRCKGCRRTLDEIARWTAMGASERDAVLADLPGRPVA